MAGRRANSGVDSLDLLLDTICNVFGGILLMAILVVLQTQTSAGRIPEPKAEDVERSLEAQRLRFECERLGDRLTVLSQHRDEIAQTFQATTSPTGERLAGAQGEFRKAIEEARHRAAAAEAAAGASRKDQTATDDALRTVERALREKQSEVAALEQELRHSQTAIPRQVRLPHRRGMASGGTRYYVVKGSRAYMLDPLRFDWFGGEQRVGDCTMTPLSFARAATVTPMDGAGLPVPRGKGEAEAFVASLARYPPNTWYIVFYVYNDSASFASFQTLKDAVAGRGYRYAAEPVIPESGSFVVVPASGHETE
jgi:hypothetical protein